ncbi:glycine cleavage system protein R [Desulforhopalus singaporensis]|uniref:Glycine cleavage system transcriptional repressor n=1 Tax=Desulforhopalus singaporensis TaxID=91360 RepID=A0A1H0PSG1_9BACT|nr:ACT domain-containing protein [Desulforhopalus singaporensis]SDP08043.1 glycine cleavage system transcriptional repressor [Desulforhopalus singaporensis]
MSNKYLLTAFSRDRVGIVADISQVIYENGYNLEDSSMMYLAGEFAILLLLSEPSSDVAGTLNEVMSKECRRLEIEKGITAFLRPVGDEKQEKKKDIVTKTINIEGHDQAGIVYRVSKFLADSNINILTLRTEVRPSPQSGTDLYVMKIDVEIPGKLNLGEVEDGLETIGDRLHVDVSIA